MESIFCFMVFRFSKLYEACGVLLALYDEYMVRLVIYPETVVAPFVDQPSDVLSATYD